MMKMFHSLAMMVATVCVAQAETAVTCMPTAELEAALKDWYLEHPAHHISADRTIWVSEQTATWTLVEQRQDGQSCTLAQGANWSAKRLATLEKVQTTQVLATLRGD